MKNSILIISAVFPPEPVVSSKLSFDLAIELSKSFNVVVISPYPSRPFGFQFEEKSKNYNFKHVYMDSFRCPQSNMFGRFKESVSFGLKCAEYIRIHNKEIDKIYSNSWPLFAQFFAIKASKKFGIPFTFHVQDIYPESLSNKIMLFRKPINRFLSPIDRFNLKNSKNIVVISEIMKSYLIKTRKLDPSKFSVVFNWQDEQEFLNLLPSNNSKELINNSFTFMYLGNVGPVAGIDLLIKAFVLADLKHSKLVIAGSGSKKDDLMKMATGYPNSNIKFCEVPDGMVPQIQNKADVMLLPVIKGGAFSSIPSKLPAYMFSKKPIIASVDENSDISNAIKNSNCGWVSKPEDIESLALLMKKVFLLEKKKLNIKGANGFKFAMQNFSKKINLPKLVKIIS